MKLTSIICCTALLSVFHVFEANAQLTDYQRFTSYPYIEKAYRLEQQEQFGAALEEAKRALAVAPEHMPYIQYVFQLSLLNEQPEIALDALLAHESQSELLENWIEAVVTLENAEKQLALWKLASSKSVIKEEQYFSFTSKLLDRLVGSGQPQKALDLLQLAQNREGFDNNFVELQFALLVELDNIDAAKRYYINHESEATEQMRQSFVEIVLNSEGNDAAFSTFLNVNNESVRRLGMVNWVQRQIGLDDQAAAMKGLKWLFANGLSDDSLNVQLLEVLTAENDAFAIDVVKTGNFSCKQRVETLIQYNEFESAKEELLNCIQRGVEFSDWGVYAAQLLSVNELELHLQSSVYFVQEVEQILSEKYIANQNYEAIIQRIPKNSTDIEALNILLTSFENLNDWKNASEVAVRLQKLAPSAIHLDKATYALVRANDTDLAKKLLVQSIENGNPLLERSVTRLINLLEPNDLDNAEQIISFLQGKAEYRNQVSEIFRLSGRCERVLSMLAAGPLAYDSLMTIGLCHEQQGNLHLAQESYVKAFNLDEQPEALAALFNVSVQLEDIESAQFAYKNGQDEKTGSDWNAQLAQLFYNDKNYSAVIELLSKEDVLSEEGYDLLVESYIATTNYPLALDVAQRQFVEQSSFSAEQWLRQSNIYNKLNRGPEEVRAIRSALRLEPKNTDALLALGFALVPTQPKEALHILQQLEELNYPLAPEHFEQMAYLANQNEDFDLAANYMEKWFESGAFDSQERTNTNWLRRRFFGDITQNWRVLASASHGTGAILGDVFFVDDAGSVNSNLPTNNLTLRAEYFFDSLNSGLTAYAQISGNGTDNNPFNAISQELGVTYRPFSFTNLRVSTGVQKFLNANSDWEGFARINGDALNQDDFRRDWRPDTGWWQRNLYYDLMYFYESDQVLGQTIFDYGYVFNVSEEHFRTLRLYGLARYDYRKAQLPVNGQTGFDEFAVGAGLRFEQYFVSDDYRDRLDRVSASIEWRANISGELSEDTHGLFFILAYEY